MITYDIHYTPVWSGNLKLSRFLSQNVSVLSLDMKLKNTMSPQSTYSKDVRLLGSNKVFPIYLCGCSLLDINQLFSPLNQTRSSPFLSTVCLDSRNTSRFASPGEKSVCHLRIASLDGNLDTQIPLWKLKKKKTNLLSVAPTFRTKQNINAIPWWDIQKSIFPKMRCLKEVTCIQLVIFFKEQTPIIRSEKRKEAFLSL